ncbi:MAG: hypothetical protein C7B46_12975 [Sulfobacillus benefaciens]|uniref:Uncharacterized protein n=1 Tax=Sulfobacillus benefaciens TaxID=453960 RepID=A0A2T2XDU6_9FIRM|nr:MAG: hypothetical protein C7B46_12975 [Sulfobacillus benefaciens]
MSHNNYRPEVLATAWTRVVARETAARIVIGDFLDDWRRITDVTTRTSLIMAPIPDSDDTDLHRWSAFVAALVEYVTVQADMTPPAWVFDDRWTLPEPWFINPYWKLRIWQLVVTPPPWKRRRIFGGDETTMIGRV